MTDDASLEFYHGWLNRVPEYLGLVALGVLVAVTYQGAESLPARIPTHFGAGGAPDSWGPKYMLYMLAGIVAVIYGGLTLLQRTPRIYNYPVRVTDENRARLHLIAVGLVRWIKAEMALVFTYIQWAVGQVGTGQAAGLSPAVMIGLVALLLGTAAFFTGWMVKAR
jgi:uncharacterized membrane protein